MRISLALCLGGLLAAGCAHNQAAVDNLPVMLAVLLQGFSNSQNNFETSMPPLDPAIHPIYTADLKKGGLEYQIHNFAQQGYVHSRKIYLVTQAFHQEHGQWPTNKEELMAYSVAKSSGPSDIDWASYENIVTSTTVNGALQLKYGVYVLYGEKSTDYLKVHMTNEVPPTGEPASCEELSLKGLQNKRGEPKSAETY